MCSVCVAWIIVSDDMQSDTWMDTQNSTSWDVDRFQSPNRATSCSIIACVYFTTCDLFVSVCLLVCLFVCCSSFVSLLHYIYLFIITSLIFLNCVLNFIYLMVCLSVISFACAACHYKLSSYLKYFWKKAYT